MYNKKECAEYFRQQKELKRFFIQIRGKWESYGRSAGKITLKNCSEEERKAIGKILGKVYWEETIQIFLSEIENALQNTRFAPITLQELLEEYFGEKIITTREKNKTELQRKKEFFEKIQHKFEKSYLTENQEKLIYQKEEKDEKDDFACAFCQKENSCQIICSWYQEMQETKKYGYAILMREQEKHEEIALQIAENIGKAFLLTQEFEYEEIPLAVLAAKVTGNPHYFDRGSTAGNLLISCFCYVQKCEFPVNAMEWKEVLLRARVLPDDMASTVIAYRVHLVKENGLHMALESFYQMYEPVILTRLHLKNVLKAYGESQKVFIVENEMVFSYLFEKVKEYPVTLLCTSGQIRTAAIELIQLLAEGGMEIYYSGDIDPEGMGIADRLWQKYPQKVHIWRMSPKDYKKGMSQEKIASRSLSILKNIKNPELKKTTEDVIKEQKAAYQENLLMDLLEDLLFYYSE